MFDAAGRMRLPGQNPVLKRLISDHRDAAWRTLGKKLRLATRARIGLGRAGDAMKITDVLDFQFAHAKARDAVHTKLDVPALQAALPGAIHVHSEIEGPGDVSAPPGPWPPAAPGLRGAIAARRLRRGFHHQRRAFRLGGHAECRPHGRSNLTETFRLQNRPYRHRDASPGGTGRRYRRGAGR